MFRESLADIANRHGTDKGPQGPSRRAGGHNYTDVYEAYMSARRDDEVTLLEIGIGLSGPHWQASVMHGRNAGGGASLKMWHDYFPNGTIVGVDINDASAFDGPRVRTFVVDQGEPASWSRFLADSGIDRFDYVIDDGSHRPDHQQISFSCLFDRVAPGGVYFIEDLGDNGYLDAPKYKRHCESVYNTRRVFKALKYRGEVLSPNALLEADRLKDRIAEISFHCPVPEVDARTLSRVLAKRIKRKKPIKRSRFREDSEKLCAITKR